VSELSGFIVFLETNKTDLCENLFSEFRRKHLFITTCIEKYCIISVKLGDIM